MKIEKYKKLKNGKYKITFSNQKDIELYEEVILKHSLLLKSVITPQLLLDITSENEFYEVYYQALKLIKIKSRTEKEIVEALKKKDYPENLIKESIDKLCRQNYLDDQFYAKAYVHTGIMSTKGPYRIINELEKKGVNKKVIASAMEEYTNDIEEEIVTKRIKKMIQSNHTKSNLTLKKKIVTDFIQHGFHKEILLKVINQQEFQDDQDIIKKEYEKIYQKLSKKYEGKELEYKVKQKMYQKGMYYDD